MMTYFDRIWLTTLTITFTSCLIQLPAFSQHNHNFHSAQYPEQLALDSKKQKLDQDEKNIALQELTINEFNLKAIKISRNLEALSFTTKDDMSPRLQEYAAELQSELKRIEQHIASMKMLLNANRSVLEVETANLRMDEERRKTWISSQHGDNHKPPADKWGDEIRARNEQLIKEADQRQKDITLQNAKLIALVSGESNPFPTGHPDGIALLPAGGSYDAAELALCQALMQKASANDYDIAEINLLAAKGLPGAENLDVDKTLKTLDLWAAWVKHETDRHLYKFKKAPEDYSDSEGYFRILMMVCTLQEDFKICYNKDPKMRTGPVEVVPNDFTFFGNPQDLFIHGLTEGEHQGTCASLPVLYVAVGRRLGYPLKLVECKGHLFVRWEDAKERFNIEGTSRGLNCYPDQEYMEWPWPISKEEMATGMYMKSLSPKREVSAFLELRALCLKQHQREKQHKTVKLFADDLRKKEGVDLDTLNKLMREYSKKHSADGTVESALMYQTLTNTNSWRTPGDERGAPGKHTVFAIERFDSK